MKNVVLILKELVLLYFCKAEEHEDETPIKKIPVLNLLLILVMSR